MTDKKINRAAMEAAFDEAAKIDNRCNLGKLLDGLEADVRRVLESKVENDLVYSAATISRVLKGLGFPPVSSETISKHRRGACRCV